MKQPRTRPAGAAARAHLAAGRAIYYSEDATPEGLLIKEYPDGRRELVKFDEGGDIIIKALPSLQQ
ncbi:TPA: hypothetical protein ACWS6R_000084 [Klebsiella pneumoniae]|uniref:hypothetical protein n=1 Tax=Klebsiella sp. GG_Kp140 TaxID=3153451 RepID=UPI0032B37836|nr:hypothetical protein [Klebsiella pneumoniae]